MATKYKAFLFFEEDATKKLLKKILEKRGYDVFVYEYPKDCSLLPKDACSCTKEERCADLMILGQHMGPIRAIKFVEKQVEGNCKLAPFFKMVINSIYDEREAQAANKLGVTMFYLPFPMDEFNKWLDEREKRLE